MIRRAALLSLALAGLAAAARAHDFWIEPSSFQPAVGTELSVSLRVGQDFHGDPVPRNPKLIRSFVLVSAAGQTPIGGLAGADPAGSVRIADAGILWIAYRSDRKPVTLDAEKFEKYLAEEGLDAILEARRKSGDGAKPGREVFSRSVKAMLVAGPPEEPARGFDRVLGLTLEIVPERNPARTAPGTDLPVRLLFEGKPLSGALLVAMNQAEPEKKLTASSDGNGRASFRLPRQGIWLLKAVHMQAAPAGVGADWESVWASMTFEVP